MRLPEATALLKFRPTLLAYSVLSWMALPLKLMPVALPHTVLPDSSPIDVPLMPLLVAAHTTLPRTTPS